MYTDVLSVQCELVLAKNSPSLCSSLLFISDTLSGGSNYPPGLSPLRLTDSPKEEGTGVSWAARRSWVVYSEPQKWMLSCSVS